MVMRVALAIVPAWSPLTAPLGIASIAGAVKSAGYPFRVFDLNSRLWKAMANHPVDLWDYGNYLQWQDETNYYNNTLPLIGTHLQSMVDEIIAWQPDVLGLSLFETSFFSGRYVAQQVKQVLPNTTVIFGGPGTSRWALNNYNEFENGSVDIAVLGEGEATIIDVLHRLKNNTPLAGCLGTTYRLNKKVVFEPPRPNMNLNDLPFPYFDDFSLSNYKDGALPIMMSRGCVAKCTFCSETRYWTKFRYRQADHIFEELKNMVHRHKVKRVAIADSLLNGNFRVLNELVDLINANQLKVRWGGYARIDKRMTRDLLQRMAQAGCRHLSFGLESGSQKVMDLMEKNTTVECARRVVRETHEAGIQVHLNMIVGFPGELEEDFQATLDFVDQHAQYVHTIITGETCGIPVGTPLDTHPGRFGIKTLPNGNIYWEGHNGWMTEDGLNTNEIRHQRLRRLRQKVDSYSHIRRFPLEAGQPREISLADPHP